MEDVLVGCGQLTWPKGTPPSESLAEIAQAGYDGAPASPGLGGAEDVRVLFATYGLRPAPGYLGANFWDPEQEDAIIARAESLARFMQALDCTELYVAAGGFQSYVGGRGLNRAQIAGHVKPEDAMSDAEFEQFARTLDLVGAITLRYGVRSCFHNHVGSTIETREEIDRLFSMVNREVVFMGPDIGHLAWAGVDSVEFCRDYAEAIKSLHVKDIDGAVLKQGVAEGWDYGQFSSHGIFAELGEGFVNFPAIFEILEDAGFTGWVIVETDVTQKPTALESATISRDYLRTLGI